MLHCFASFRITCPIYVCRQLAKHSYLRINEVSRRYIKTTPDVFYPDVWRSSITDKKQGSGNPLPQGGQILAMDAYDFAVSSAVKSYDQLFYLFFLATQLMLKFLFDFLIIQYFLSRHYLLVCISHNAGL